MANNNGLTPVQIKELLQRERDGKLDQTALDAIAQKREQKTFPPALPKPQAKPELTFAQRMVRGAAPSIMGGAIGAGLGGFTGGLLTAGPGAVPGAAIGGALGSAGGEAVAQFFDPFKAGIEEPSLVQIGLAGAAPVIPAVVRKMAFALPGASAGLQKFLLAETGDVGERLIGKVAPNLGKTKQLFQEAAALGKDVKIPLTKFGKAAEEVSEEVSKGKFGTAASRRVARAAAEVSKEGELSYEAFRINQSQIGRAVRYAERQAGPELGEVKKLYAASWDDLNETLAKTRGPLGAKLRTAIDSFKREEAAAFLKEWFETSVSRRVGTRELGVDALMTKIDRGREVLSSLLPKGEVDDILKTLKEFSDIPMSSRAGQAGIQGMPIGQRVLVGAAAGHVAEGLGFGTQTGGGAIAGVLGVEAISLALSTRAGRALIKGMKANGMTIDQIGNALVQTGRVGGFGNIPVGVGP